ncbi:MAG: serine hydrolase [Siphonobacter sp.]
MRIIIFLWLWCGWSAFAQTSDQLADFQHAQTQTVLLNNQTQVLPFKDLNSLKIASLHRDTAPMATFDSIAAYYWDIKPVRLPQVLSDSALFALHDELKLFNTLLVEISDNTNIDSRFIEFLKNQPRQVILIASGRALTDLDGLSCPIIWNLKQTPEAASIAAQIIFGGVGASGKLETTYSPHYKKGSGFITSKIRLGYSLPEAVAMSGKRLRAIDSLVNAGIALHATPGAVVLIAREGQVIFHRAYGKHTYEGEEQTRLDDIFDMASVTKVSATTPGIMRLYDQKKVELDAPISRYIARTRLIPDKADILVKEALLHEAGYTPYIKFYEQLRPLDLSGDSSAAYPTKVADQYYLRANFFSEVMWPVTLQSPVTTRGKYVYSDLSMYMMKEVIETATQQSLDQYVLESLYRPLGMRFTGYLPRNRFAKARIVPTTQNDNWFRNRLLQGYVNDPGAAMAGGVEGHAGLFSTANDMAILYQTYLNKGTYGGVTYFEPTTIELFTARQSRSNAERGYGFDKTKPTGDAIKKYASERAYGHGGYTGTYVWVDPKYKLVYICLTNWVYPDDGKTYKKTLNLRPRILNIAYEAIQNK